MQRDRSIQVEGDEEFEPPSDNLTNLSKSLAKARHSIDRVILRGDLIVILLFLLVRAVPFL